MKDNGNVASTLTSFVVLFVSLLLPYFLSTIILANSNNLNSQSFKQKFGTLTEFLKTKTVWQA